jgi:hypothetical protein
MERNFTNKVRPDVPGPQGRDAAPMDAEAESTKVNADLVHIQLRLEGDPPAGTASLDDGQTVTFSGWEGLMWAVDTLLARRSSRPQDPQQ